MALLTFENVFDLPEFTIQQILSLNAQPSRGFLTDRYVVTVLIANGGRLQPQDYQCASNPRFRELYFDLLPRDMSNPAKQFNQLRQVLNCNLPCDEPGIRRAIDMYGDQLVFKNVGDLVREFGSNAFNSDYLDQAYVVLALTRMTGYDITLFPIIANIIKDYEYMEREYSGQRFWEYLKCLLRILQSNNRTGVGQRGIILSE